MCAVSTGKLLHIKLSELHHRSIYTAHVAGNSLCSDKTIKQDIFMTVGNNISVTSNRALYTAIACENAVEKCCIIWFLRLQKYMKGGLRIGVKCNIVVLVTILFTVRIFEPCTTNI